jgi:maleate isomerase
MDFHQLKPEGVAVYVSRVPVFGASSPQEKFEAIRRMNAEIPRAAKLLADVKPDIIAFCCTTASFLEGPGTDERIIATIREETNIDAITTTTALVEVLRYLDVATIDLLTPYIPEVGVSARNFLIQAVPKLAIANHKDLGMISGLDMCEIQRSRVYAEVTRLVSNSSDAFVISCSALQSLPTIPALESDIGKLVITSNTATMWLALRRLGIKPYIAKSGRLLGEILTT